MYAGSVSVNQPYRRNGARPADAAGLSVPTRSAADALFATALEHHGAGRLQEARLRYVQILGAQPLHHASLHLLGVILFDSGEADAAIASISRAIEIEPGEAPYHFSLARVLQARGRAGEAIAAYRRTIALVPALAEAHANLGNVLRATGELEGAITASREAVRLAPGMAEAHLNLGGALKDQGALAEAVGCFSQALALAPGLTAALSNLGDALRRLGQLDSALAACRRAVALNPHDAEAHNNLGVVLNETSRTEEARAAFETALALAPHFAEAHNNLGHTLDVQDRLDDAVAHFREAVRLKPDCAAAHANLASAALRQAGDVERAAAGYRAAIALRPDLAEAHANLAMLELSLGHYEAGWAAYEWRWRIDQLGPSRWNFAQPLWLGEPAAGTTLLIHAEQGFGDTLQFCRYAPLVAARGLRVVLQVQRPLVRLLRRLNGVADVVAQGDALPPFDLHIPMMSLPLATRTTLETIPGACPYLSPDPAEVAYWAGQLGPRAGGERRIGLVWGGNPRDFSRDLAAINRRRSIEPTLLTPLFEIPSLTFYSLQKDIAVPNGLPVIDLMHDVANFADTAGFVENLDLVISVDTAVAHLAGALGKPVWLLNRFDSCWRWLRNRRDSPWYPTLTLYNQTTPGDWSAPVAAMAADLREFASAEGQPGQSARG